MQNKCFICGKGRGEFESLGIDFEEHQKTQHGIWNYFAFLMSLHTRARNEEDFLASEFFVWKQFVSAHGQQFSIPVATDMSPHGIPLMFMGLITAAAHRNLGT